jgi:hypothetical protein
MRMQLVVRCLLTSRATSPLNFAQVGWCNMPPPSTPIGANMRKEWIIELIISILFQLLDLLLRVIGM